MINVQELTDDINKLKPIPAVVNQLLNVVDSPDCSMQDIANVIQYDLVITASVLKTCNSAYFGLKKRIETIKNAVNMLGTDHIVELVLFKSGTEIMAAKQAGYGLEEGDMWRYSVSSAVIAKQVASNLGLENKNTIFTSALIKDIGKIVLEKHMLKSSEKIKHLVEQKGLSFLEAENEVFGIDHAQLGAMMAKKWKFSPRMVKMIRHHHLTEESMVKDREIAVVYLSDCICMMIGVGVGSDGLSYRFKNQVMDRLDMKADDIAMIIAQFGIDMKKIEELLNIG